MVKPKKCMNMSLGITVALPKIWTVNLLTKNHMLRVLDHGWMDGTDIHVRHVPWCCAWELLPGVNRQVHEADHALPSSAEVKNDWSCTSTIQYVVNGVIKVRKYENSSK
jgi:hypothetical protein